MEGSKCGATGCVGIVGHFRCGLVYFLGDRFTARAPGLRAALETPVCPWALSCVAYPLLRVDAGCVWPGRKRERECGVFKCFLPVCVRWDHYIILCAPDGVDFFAAVNTWCALLLFVVPVCFGSAV